MRILPRSRRGTWLLARTVWLAACAGLWHVLPTVMTARFRFPDQTRVLGFSPAHGFALTQPNSREFENELHLSDLKSGLPVHRLPGLTGLISVLDKLSDGSVWLLCEGSEQGLRAAVLDLNARTAVPIPSNVSDSASGARLSPDGRFAALDNSGDDGLVLWNLTANKMHTFFPALRPPFAFSHDGKRVAGIEAWKSTLRIFDTDSGRLHAEFVWPARRRVNGYSLDRSGDRVAGRMLDFDDGPTMTIEEVHFAWSSSQPESISEYRNTSSQSVPGGFWVSDLAFRHDSDQLIAIVKPDDPERYWLAVADSGGRLVRQMELPGLFCEFAADRRTIVCSDANSTSRLLADYASRLGLNLGIGIGTNLMLIDVGSGPRLGTIPVSGARVWQVPEDDGLVWSPDRRQVIELTGAPERQARLYDIPPRKPLTWFAAGATLLALPIAWLARRRVRKLRAAAA